MTFEEMHEIVKKYCNDCDDCDHCAIKEPCDVVDSWFYKDKDVCEQAYKIIMGNCVVHNDPVNHPSHYTKGKIEVADFIADQKLNFDRGNAVKYVCRAGSKDPEKEIQDLEKAVWYINHEIKMLKGESENA
jgi:hypothetical protein